MKSNKSLNSVSSNVKANSNKINLVLVTDEEREKYRIPSYGYILP